MSIEVTPSDVVTTVVRRRVRPGREAAYEAWLADLQQAAAAMDGFVDARTNPPDPREPRTYTSIFRFASLEHRTAFQESGLNRQALRDVSHLVDGDPIWDTYTGLEMWFSPPPRTIAPQPVRWRMALLLGTVVYVLVLIFGTIAAALIGDLPSPIRLAIVIAVEITLMTYVLLPFLTRRLARFIFTDVATS